MAVCHARGCCTVVSAHLLMCRSHWDLVPWRDQKLIYRLWHDRFRETHWPSEAYTRETSRIIAELALKEQFAHAALSRGSVEVDEPDSRYASLRDLIARQRT